MNRMKIIQAGWLIDGSGSPVQANVQLTVVGGCIESIRGESATDFSRPDLLKPDRLDLSTCTILPALVDSLSIWPCPGLSIKINGCGNWRLLFPRQRT